MVDVTVTKTFMPYPGFAMGTATGVRDTYILDTGLAQVDGLILTGANEDASDDVHGGMRSQSNGRVTLWVWIGGSADTGTDRKASWVAWGSR